MNAKHLVMTIGLPFSGKSTSVQEYKNQGYKVIERDPLLQEIIASDFFRDEVARQVADHPDTQIFAIKNEVAIRLLSERVCEEVLAASETDVIYDGTNLQKASRAGILELTKQGVTVDAIVFHTPIEEILRRAKEAAESGSRKGAFNEAAAGSLIRMLSLTEDPEISEGFREIEVREWKSEDQEGTSREIMQENSAKR